MAALGNNEGLFINSTGSCEPIVGPVGRRASVACTGVIEEMPN